LDSRQGQYKVVISLEAVLRLLIDNDDNEVVFSFWSVPRLIPVEEEVRYYLPEGEMSTA
jgi:hypothetical protein